MGSGEAQLKPLIAFSPLEIPLVLWFPFIFKNTLKHQNPAHIRFEIIYICINKPFRVWFHCIGAFYFILRLFKENAIYIEKSLFLDLKIYQISFIILLGLVHHSRICYQPCSLALL